MTPQIMALVYKVQAVGKEKAAKLLPHDFQLRGPPIQRHRKLLPNRLPPGYWTLLIINTDARMVLNGFGNRR